jgi:hypothetical protein
MIESALPENSAHCMIAEGVKAAYPKARRVSVDLATIRFTDPATNTRFIYLTPRPAQLALLDFDHGDHPEPFTVQASVAQVVAAKASAAKGTTEAAAKGPTGPAKKRTRKRAVLIENTRSGSRRVPIKVGGNAPPMGVLARGSGSNKPRAGARTGQIRSFGLKAMGH